MKFINLKFKIKNLKFQTRGFILPFAMMLSYVILIISMGISDILTKEMFFSFIGRESQIAYYAADAGLDCALYLDAAFVDSSSGVGIFPSDKIDGTWEGIVLNQSQYALATSTIRCAGAEIFNADSAKSNYKTTAIDGSNPVNGVESTFMLRMVQGTTNDSCALVSIDKKVTTSTSTRRIISRGYNTCDMNNKKLVERAIVNMQ